VTHYTRRVILPRYLKVRKQQRCLLECQQSDPLVPVTLAIAASRERRRASGLAQSVQAAYEHTVNACNANPVAIHSGPIDKPDGSHCIA
jgi:hypothetical protein